MRAILLAAGLGTRLHPLTTVLPKCLMPVNGRPLLEYWLLGLKKADISEVLVNTHYKPDLVRGWLAARRGGDSVRLTYEPELLGTAGTLLANRRFFDDGPVMLVHADNLCTAPLDAFQAAHRKRAAGCAMTMMSFTTDTPSQCGILDVDARGVVRAFHEKVANPPGNLANGAVYILEPEVVDYAASLCKPNVDFSTEIVPRYVGRIQSWHNPGYHRDIGTVDSFLRAQIEDHNGEGLGHDEAWSALCDDREDSLFEKFAAALGQALSEPVSSVYSISGARIAQRGIVAIPRMEYMETVLRLTREIGADVADYIIVIEKAPSGFLARRIWHECGLRCVAFCQTNTTRLN